MPKVIVALLNEAQEFQQLQARDARTTAAKLGLDVEVVFAEGHAVVQIQQLFAAIHAPEESRPAAIVVEAAVAEGLERVARNAVKAGMGWVLVNVRASYLEALRTIAALDPAFFRSIYAFARERYDTDKATYHVSAELGRAPEAKDVQEIALPDLLEQFHAREILHVTFGSVLKETGPDGKPRFKDTFFGLLRGNPEAYAANLERHFVKHLKPFVGGR